ncbi:hypothetical protein AB205_0192180, partial [Aquarana catesbeiana]
MPLTNFQIKESAAQTRETLRQHFQDMKNAVSKMLDERLAILLQQVDTVEHENIKPLDDCQKLLEHGVSTAEDLLREGEVVVSDKTGKDHQNLCHFTNKAFHIQLDSLPEVPSLVEVPCLSAQLDDTLLSVARDQIFSHGAVASRPPVQIEELIERPGGILVKWCKIKESAAQTRETLRQHFQDMKNAVSKMLDERLAILLQQVDTVEHENIKPLDDCQKLLEHGVDDEFVVQDYRLQYRRHNSGHFEDAYVGPECEFMVLQIDPNVDYQFRVCARGDGRQEWSPWSVPQIGHTCLIPH